MTAYEMRISDWSSDGCSSDLPVQYSCQQNFTILSTDGYWNGSEDAAVQINGSTKVGNQDATELRPMYDGTVTANVTYTTATLTFTGSSDTSVTSITVNGKRITDNSTNSSDSSTRVASRVDRKSTRLNSSH